MRRYATGFEQRCSWLDHGGNSLSHPRAAADVQAQARHANGSEPLTSPLTGRHERRFGSFLGRADFDVNRPRLAPGAIFHAAPDELTTFSEAGRYRSPTPMHHLVNHGTADVDSVEIGDHTRRHPRSPTTT